MWAWAFIDWRRSLFSLLPRRNKVLMKNYVLSPSQNISRLGEVYARERKAREKASWIRSLTTWQLASKFRVSQMKTLPSTTESLETRVSSHWIRIAGGDVWKCSGNKFEALRFVKLDKKLKIWQKSSPVWLILSEFYKFPFWIEKFCEIGNSWKEENWRNIFVRKSILSDVVPDISVEFWIPEATHLRIENFVSPTKASLRKSSNLKALPTSLPAFRTRCSIFPHLVSKANASARCITQWKIDENSFAISQKAPPSEAERRGTYYKAALCNIKCMFREFFDASGSSLSVVLLEAKTMFMTFIPPGKFES